MSKVQRNGTDTSAPRPAIEQLESCMARIGAENGQLHSISRVHTERAIQRANELDRSLTEGATPGPLYGLPTIVKELVDIEGYPTEFGSMAFASTAASETAPAIRRLEDAGAIIVGTAHMVEFASGSWGTNYVKGTPWNPADRHVHRVAGGSSSGSGVAVAAGLVPIAIGTDTGGSVRIPASLCGVVGLKPTFGLIPNKGVAPLGPTFDTLGPLTRTVADARRVTEIMAGISLAHEPVELDRLRIAVPNKDDLSPIAEEVGNAYDTALAKLEAEGAQLASINLPLSFVDFQSLNGDIVAFEAYSNLDNYVDDPALPLDPHVRKRIKVGRGISRADYEALLIKLTELRLKFEAAFREFDVLVLPGTPITAARIEEVDESEIPMSRFTRISNCLDLCSITLPISRTNEELPVGLQLCARASADAFLLAVADQVEGII